MSATAAAFGFGLVAGSFLNVCIHRWPIGQSVVSPRSRCPRCSAGIAWYDNIPLLSFALLRGRCRNCGGGIAWRYPLVELLNGLAYGMIAAQFGTGAEAWKLAILASMMLILFFTDLAHLILPDQVTLPGIATGIAFSWFVPLRPGIADALLLSFGSAPPQGMVSLTESVLGAALFGGVLILIGEIFYRLRGIEGLGRGDVKLLAMIAAFQGTSEALLVLLVACTLATICGSVAVLAGGKQWRDPLPLGSYVAGVALACIFVASAILNRYWEIVLG